VYSQSYPLLFTRVGRTHMKGQHRSFRGYVQCCSFGGHTI
jgi:hypothetical protein